MTLDTDLEVGAVSILVANITLATRLLTVAIHAHEPIEAPWKQPLRAALDHAAVILDKIALTGRITARIRRNAAGVDGLVASAYALVTGEARAACVVILTLTPLRPERAANAHRGARRVIAAVVAVACPILLARPRGPAPVIHTDRASLTREANVATSAEAFAVERSGDAIIQGADAVHTARAFLYAGGSAEACTPGLTGRA
jgi:hypothetical protein